MTITCTICISDLNSEVPAALSCGHVFHKDCIDSWINNKSQRHKLPCCPLCKKSIYKRNIMPLFFSFNDSVEAESRSSVQDKILIGELRDKNSQNKQENKSLKLELEEERDNVKITRQQLDNMRRLEEENCKKIRYLRQLKSVTEIDEYMAQPTTQTYLQNVTHLPRAELVVAFGALRGKCAQAAKKRDIAHQKYNIAMGKEERLRNKVKKITDELSKLKNAESSKPKQFTPANFIQYGRPDQYRTSIAVDTDEEQEEKDTIKDENRGLASDEEVRSDVGTSRSHRNETDNKNDESDDDDDSALFSFTDEAGVPVARQPNKKRKI